MNSNIDRVETERSVRDVGEGSIMEPETGRQMILPAFPHPGSGSENEDRNQGTDTVRWHRTRTALHKKPWLESGLNSW